MRYPMITGHTGNDGTQNNSIESIHKSISLGADAFEVDIRKAGDSDLVLSHDAHGPSGYDTYLRLGEAFEIAAQHPDIRINCDLKDDDLPLEVVALANSFGIGVNRLILSGSVATTYLSSHPELVQMADVYLNAECIFEKLYFQETSQAKTQSQYDAFRENPWKYIKRTITSIDPYIGILSETCLEYGVKGINIPYVCLTDQSIKGFKKYGVPLSVWTVNEETEMTRLFSYGIENLTTRCVDKAKSIRKNLLGF